MKRAGLHTTHESGVSDRGSFIDQSEASAEPDRFRIEALRERTKVKNSKISQPQTALD
jgi:hypothetical protein